MMPVLFSLLLSLRRSFRPRAALQAEILALRHQLLILQRANRNRRLELSAADRRIWVWLSRFWPGWRSALLIRWLEHHKAAVISADGPQYAFTGEALGGA